MSAEGWWNCKEEVNEEVKRGAGEWGKESGGPGGDWWSDGVHRNGRREPVAGVSQ